MATLNSTQLSRLLYGATEIGKAQFIKMMDPKKDLISIGMAICTFGKGFIDDMIMADEISGTKFSKVELLILFYS